MTNISTTSPRRVVQIGDKHYALLRQFNDGHLSVVWQAQLIADSKRNAPGYFHEVHTTQKELLATLQKQDDIRHKPDSTIEGRVVAIKSPNSPDAIQDLRAEAKNLRQLRGASTRSQRLIELIDDHSGDAGCPCLILAWAKGTQLDNFTQPISERDGLSVGFQVAQVIEAVFNLRYTPLNDSIKPNSIFWDEDNRRATIIDLGLVGEHMADLETQTLPIFGDTLHRVLTSQHVGKDLDDKGAPIPDQLWAGTAKESWQKLSFGTRQIVQRLFDSTYLPQPTKELKGNDLYNCLSQTVGAVRNAIEEQIALWDEPDSKELLQKAHQTKGAEAINYFDIAWGKGEIPTEEDRELYLGQWHTLIGGWLASTNHETARFDIHWFHEYVPSDPFGKRAWLANEAALEDAALDWPTVLHIFKQMNAGDASYVNADFSQAAQFYETAWGQIKHIDSRLLQEIQNEARNLLLLVNEQIFFVAVDKINIGKTNDMRPLSRNERAELLREALASWHGLKNLQVGDKEGSFERRSETEQMLFLMIEEQVFGEYHLNKYGNIAAWITTLRAYAPEKIDLVRKAEEWGEKQAAYDQQMARYQRYSGDLQAIIQARATINHEAYRDVIRQQHIVVDLITLLKETIVDGFSFDLQGRSLHLTLGTFLADLGRYAEAANRIEASLPIFKGILASADSNHNNNKAWLSADETTQIEHYLNNIEELATQQRKMLIDYASPDVLQFHLAQQRDNPPSAKSYLTRLGLVQMLSSSSEQEIGELQKYAEHIEEKKTALSYLSLALIADSTNETTQTYFNNVLDVWLDDKRKKLDEDVEKQRRNLNTNVVQKLETILDKKRVDQAITELDQWLQVLQKTPMEQHSSAAWLTLANHIRQTQSLIDALSDASGNLYQQTLTKTCQNTGVMLTELISTLDKLTIAPKFDNDSDWLVDILKQWIELLPQLAEKLIDDQVNVDWEDLKKRVAISFKDAQRTVAMALLRRNLPIHEYKTARQNLNSYYEFKMVLNAPQG